MWLILPGIEHEKRIEEIEKLRAEGHKCFISTAPNEGEILGFGVDPDAAWDDAFSKHDAAETFHETTCFVFIEEEPELIGHLETFDQYCDRKNEEGGC